MFKCKWSKGELGWLIGSIIAVIFSSIFSGDTIFNTVVGLIGVTYVILIAKGLNISNLVGIVYVGIYGITAFNAGFYGDFIMNLIIIPLYIASYIIWKKNETDGSVEARSLSRKNSIIMVIGIIIAIFLFNILLVALGGNYTLADSANSILTIMAMVLTIGRYSQQWWMWLTNNIISTTMWVMALMSGAETSLSVVVLKVIILINSVWGLYIWTKRSKNNG